MKHILTILLALTFGQLLAQSIELTLEHDGEMREYIVYIPQGYNETNSEPLPLVINMHGLGSSNSAQFFYTNFHPIADTEQFFLVYPQGLARSLDGNAPRTHWNANFGTDVDDIGFLNAMLDTIANNYKIDPARVYSTGMSNGGYMSYVLACELSDRIAAIASVTGTMNRFTASACTPNRSIPILQIHGTADEVVPYNGDPFFNLPIQDVIEYWVENNGCDTLTQSFELENTSLIDNSTVSVDQYANCDGDTEVHFYTVHNGGHSWPGALAVPGLGVTNQDFSATATIWAFFQRFEHPNPRPIVTSTTTYLPSSVLEVYPTLFQDQLHIKAKETGIVQLLDTVGEIHWSGKLSIGEIQKLQLSDLISGLYLLQFTTSTGRMTQKLIKQ